MKKIIGLLLVLTLAVGVCAGLTSCGEPDNAGAEIPVYLGDAVYDFDPTDYYADKNADQLMSLLFEPLFTLDDDGDLEYAAAEDYEVDEEERKIVIELRESYWSDGARVTADHFIYAWRDVILDPNNANPAAALLYDIENAVEIKNGKLSTSEFGATASLFEITIIYREGADYERLLKNLASVATSPIRQDADNQAPGYWSKSSNTIMTNGPFYLATVDYAQGELTVSRNVGYHQPTTKVDYDNEVIPYKLVGTFTVNGAETEISYSDLESKTVFFMSDAPISDRKSSTEVYDDLSTYSYVFNTNNPLFAKSEVRRALSLAVDRNAIISAIAVGKAATGFIAPLASEGIEQSLITANANKAEAERLLSEAGVSGGAFTITVNDDEESRAIAEIVKGNWQGLGFTVSVKYASTIKNTVTDFATNSKVEIVDSELQVLLKEASYGNWDFDVLAVDLQMYSRDAFVALAGFTSNMNGNGAVFGNGTFELRSNIAGWKNESYDKLITRAYETENEDSRSGYLKEAEKILVVDEAVIVPLVFNQTAVYVHDDLSDITVNGLGNIVFTEAELKNYEDYLEEE